MRDQILLVFKSSIPRTGLSHRRTQFYLVVFVIQFPDLEKSTRFQQHWGRLNSPPPVNKFNYVRTQIAIIPMKKLRATQTALKQQQEKETK